MALGNGSLVRCVKHPSHLSTGFCSFCLLERLSTVGLAKPNPEKTENFDCDVIEISIVSPKFKENKEKPKTTLRALFELDDEKSEITEGSESKLPIEDEFESKELQLRKTGVSAEETESHERCSMESPKENQLKRSSSLRCACEWIACCNCDSDKKTYNWGKVLDNSIIVPIGGFARRKSHMLKRSLSESCKDRRPHEAIAHEKENAEISHICKGENAKRVDSQKKEWKLGRSWSLHCPSSSPSSNNGGKNRLLRFYFAPSKNNRRGVNKNVKKKKGLLGIFGFNDLA